MELRQVRSFVVLAEKLHFGRAAAHLHMSTPALSQQIKSLERDLGITLFSRDRRHVDLTEGGAVFLKRAVTLLAVADAAVQELRDHARGVSGVLRIGLFVNNAAELTVPILQRFRAEYPAVRVEFVWLDFAGQISAFLEDRVDVAFVRSLLVNPALDVRVVAFEPRAVLLPWSSPLAEAPSLSLEDLRDTPFFHPDEVDMPSTWTDFWLLTEERESVGSARVGERQLDGFAAVVADIAVHGASTTVPFSLARDVGGAPVTHVVLDDLDCQIAVAKLAHDSRDMVDRFLGIAEETAQDLISLVPGARAN